MPRKLRIGVSACLLGERVRYDGQHKHERYITEVLGRHFDLVAVCPEVECGLPIPREAMRLEGDPGAPRLVTITTKRDLTDRMLDFVSRRVRKLDGENLCGFIFKKGSPSSGLLRVKVYRRGISPANGSGLFARAVAERFPLMPLEEEGRLNDLALRENFLERVYACGRWKHFLAAKPRPGDLVAFHTDHKLQVMAHSPVLYREMGRLVARGGGSWPETLKRYGELLMRALALMATARKNVNVLHHAVGYFKKDLDSWEKAELLEVIEHYRGGTLPLVVPVTLLRHYVRKHGKDYLERQTFLSPHPDELMLRNHA